MSARHALLLVLPFSGCQCALDPVDVHPADDLARASAYDLAAPHDLALHGLVCDAGAGCTGADPMACQAALECGTGTASVTLCNRGDAPTAGAVAGTFYLDEAQAFPACDATTAGPLAPGQCERVSCDAPDQHGFYHLRFVLRGDGADCDAGDDFAEQVDDCTLG